MTVTRTILAVTLVLVCLCGSTPTAQGSIPFLADRFADSVGVNIHLHHTDTPYGDFELVRSRLVELGARHVRDGLIPTTWQPYYDRHNALGTLGIKGLFIAGAKVSEAALRSFPAKVASSFEGYEGPNEYDLSGDSSWTGTLHQSLVQLRALQSLPGAVDFPVYGPSLTSQPAFIALGDVSTYVDSANMHNYMSGRHPGTRGWGTGGYGSIDWNLDLARRYSPGRPVVSTETGYWDDPAVRDSLPPAVVARYMPRLLLEQFRKGIERTYIYELIDDRVSGIEARSGYGLVRADGSRKPAFSAVANLQRILSDRGAQPAPVPFDYSVDGGGPDLRNMAFQKRDGTMLIALWVERSGYDLHARRAIDVPPQSATITVPSSSPLVKAYRWQDDGSVQESTQGASQTAVSISVTDSLTVLQFRSPTAGPAAPTNLRVLQP